MPSNVGNIDRILRAVAGIVLLVLAYSQSLSGWGGWILAAAGLGLLASAAFRFCPAYKLLGVDTCGIRRT